MAGHKSDERRRTARVEKIQLVQVSRIDQEGFEADVATGRTLNLSPGGMRLELSHALPLRALITLSLGLAEDIVEMTGRVVYLEVVDDERVAIGIAFVDLDPAIGAKIERYLNAD